jgi:hypothetical protein
MAYNNFAGPRQTSQVWFPVNNSLLPPIASSDSQESFASQVPLPYHLPAAQSQEEIYGQPYGQNMYGGPSPREGFPYQPAATFNPSPMSPYLQGEYNNQGLQELSGPPPQQMGYGGNFDPYNQEQPTQDGYGGQYRSGYPRPQPVYAGNPYPPPSNYQSPPTSWSTGYHPQSNDGQNSQVPYGRPDEQAAESNYYQGQGSNAAYGSSGGSSTNQQGNGQSDNQGVRVHRRPFSGSWRNIRSEDSQNNHEQGGSSNSGDQFGVFVARLVKTDLANSVKLIASPTLLAQLRVKLNKLHLAQLQVQSAVVVSNSHVAHQFRPTALDKRYSPLLSRMVPQLERLALTAQSSKL